jgi:hypothetical protein
MALRCVANLGIRVDLLAISASLSRLRDAAAVATWEGGSLRDED